MQMSRVTELLCRSLRPRCLFGNGGGGPATGGSRPFPGVEAWAECARRIRAALLLRRAVTAHTEQAAGGSVAAGPT